MEWTGNAQPPGARRLGLTRPEEDSVPRAQTPASAWPLRAASFVALLACVALPARADAYVVRQTSTGAPVHWPSDAVNLEVDPTLVAAVPGALEAARLAAAGWTLAAAGPNLSVITAGSASSPAVDGHNVVYFIPGYAAAGSALAITLVSYDDVTGEIVDTDIVINGRYSFAVLAPGARPVESAMTIANDPAVTSPAGDSADEGGRNGSGAEFDLVHVLSHETGHVLGLRDSKEATDDVMYLFTSAGDAARRAPAADDVAGIAFLYADVPATPAHACAASPVDLAASRGSAVVFPFAVALLALGRQLRRREPRTVLVVRSTPRRPRGRR
jgi:hypothetical protein